MSKTPYEIRLEVLKMAQDAALQQFYVNNERVMNSWQAQVETARIRNETPPEMPQMPDFPSEAIVVNKAEFLGEYINNASK
jgi:hypothetical protein